MPFYTKTELTDIVRKIGIRLDKRRGQCFLIDKNIVDIIIDAANLEKENDRVLEIGSGLGTLSDRMVKKTQKTILIDNDQKILEFLSAHFSDLSPRIIDLEKINDNEEQISICAENDLVIVKGDILKYPIPDVNKVIGNIPYQISAPLIFKLLEEWNFTMVLLMVQKEFAERLTAEVNSSNYSRLAASTRLYFHIEKIHDVSNSCFYPQPRVTSTIISIRARKSLKDRNNSENIYKDEYLSFLNGIFPYKNKNLKNCVKYYLEREPQAREIFKYFERIIDDQDFRKQFPVFREKLRALSPKTLFKVMQAGREGNFEELKNQNQKERP